MQLSSCSESIRDDSEVCDKEIHRLSEANPVSSESQSDKSSTRAHSQKNKCRYRYTHWRRKMAALINNNRLMSRAANNKLTVIMYTIIIVFCLIEGSGAIAPTIDYSHNMRILKLPQSTPVGSLIYRLKGSDGDPNTQLVFGVSGVEGRGLVDVLAVAGSWNEADVYLRAPLEESSYNLTIYVSDGNKTTQVESTILPTDDQSAQPEASTPFVNPRHVFQVPESAKAGESIGQVTALESEKSDLPVRFELRGKGADKFSIKYVFGPKAGQSRADIVLAQQIDYEKQNLFALKVLALNAWTNSRLDTRNVATLDIVVVLADVQDSAPVFKNLPQSLRIWNTMEVGDVLIKMEAEDGDYADQRPINYALDAASPLSSYFDIDKSSGEIKLLRPPNELALHTTWDSASWSILTVFASEVPDSSSYERLWPPMYARAELPIVLVDMVNEPPKFIGGWQSVDSRSGLPVLHGYLLEPSEPEASGVQLVRWYTNSSANSDSLLADNLSKSVQNRPLVLDLGLGPNGTFELTLEGADAALFQLDPSFPVSKRSTFSLQVASDSNRSLLDHELVARTNSLRTGLSVDIVARDFGSPVRQTARIRCAIELLDANDNAPQFDSDLYSFSVYENAQIGQILGTVRARDPDSNDNGRVQYIALTGQDSQLFKLDPESGQVTLEGHLDREKKSVYLFLVEARDSSHEAGKSNYSQLMVTVLDVNDNAPVFLQSHYDAVLLSDGTFQQPLVVRALDADEANGANSQVAYEIIAGNQNELFTIDAHSGAIYPTGATNQPSNGKGPPSNVLPPTLTEPIEPFEAGKIRPNHEIEGSGGVRARTAANRSSENPIAERRAKSGRVHAGSGPALDVEQLPALDLLLSLESSELPDSGGGVAARSPQQAQVYATPPLTTLIVRAHDFGIPLRSASVKVNIYNQALQSRSLSVILNGTAEQLEQRRQSIERAFSSITGSRATIESIDALSESSSISVARIKLAVPQHSLVDLTDLSALMNALDYRPHDFGQARYPTLYGIDSKHIQSLNSVVSSNFTNPNNILTDIQSYALDSGLERRLLVYIIIVAVCILALLVIWMIYSCSREDQVKIIEKPSSGRLNDLARYQQVTSDAPLSIPMDANNRTLVKSADGVNSSPIGNNLAKSQRANLLLLPEAGKNLLKQDHFSMYNGQVWFEPGGPALSAGQRRASSAPSAASLDSALHSAIGRAGRGGPRNASGQFFPNTIGYTQNLAAMSNSEPSAYSDGRRLARRYRAGRKVAPLQEKSGRHLFVGAPSKPPRVSMAHGGAFANEAFQPDDFHRLESVGRRSRRPPSSNGDQQSQSSRASSLGAESVLLDSDQELLGFDSTGTPIIATHTRTPASKSLVIDMMEPTATLADSARFNQRRRLQQQEHQRRGLLQRARELTPDKGAVRETQPEAGKAEESDAIQASEGPIAASEGGQQVKEIEQQVAKSSASGSETGPQTSVEQTPPEQQPEATGTKSSELEKANSQGDLMSELSEKLNRRKQLSVDAETSIGAGESATINNEASVDSSQSTTTNGAVEAQNQHLRDMKNGQLLEKQSIFALTYSGLNTDKLSE